MVAQFISEWSYEGNQKFMCAIFLRFFSNLLTAKPKACKEKPSFRLSCRTFHRN